MSMVTSYVQYKLIFKDQKGKRKVIVVDVTLRKLTMEEGEGGENTKEWRWGASSSSSPEEQQHGLRERLEIVVPVDLCVVPQRYFTKHLHGREGSSHSTQDMALASTGGSDRSLGQSKSEAGCPEQIKSERLPSHHQWYKQRNSS